MPTPQLGYGQRTEAPINAVNQYMRSAPWYQALIRSFGQDPNNVHLSDNQKQQVIRAAQANGIVVDEGHNGQEVDDSGNFQAKSHALRNTLIVAGIAGATLATMGAAGVFAGGAAAAGSGAAAGTGTLASTAIGSGLAAPIAGGTGLATAGTGAGTLGSLAGIGHFLATPGGSTLASTLAGTFSNIYGANKTADAARYGVDAQTKAQNYAADLNEAAAQRAEAFQRQQAEVGWQSGEHTNKANYDQWAAKQHAIMGSLGQQLGINYTAPEYSAGVDPRYTEAGAPSTSGGADPRAFIADWQSRNAPNKMALLTALQKAGFNATDYKYGDVSSGNEIALNGQKYKVLSNENSANPQHYVAGTNDSGVSAQTRPVGTLASFVAPKFLPYQVGTPLPSPYQPGTLGAYVGRV